MKLFVFDGIRKNLNAGVNVRNKTESIQNGNFSGFDMNGKPTRATFTNSRDGSISDYLQHTNKINQKVKLGNNDILNLNLNGALNHQKKNYYMTKKRKLEMEEMEKQKRKKFI